MKLNEKYSVIPSAAIPDTRNVRHHMEGRVVYVHPKGRYAELEFKGVNGTFRESFRPDQLTEKNLIREKKRRK